MFVADKLLTEDLTRVLMADKLPTEDLTRVFVADELPTEHFAGVFLADIYIYIFGADQVFLSGCKYLSS